MQRRTLLKGIGAGAAAVAGSGIAAAEHTCGSECLDDDDPCSVACCSNCPDDCDECDCHLCLE